MGNQAEFREIRRAPFRPRAHMQNLKSDTVHTPLCAPAYEGTFWLLEEHIGGYTLGRHHTNAVNEIALSQIKVSYLSI